NYGKSEAPAKALVEQIAKDGGKAEAIQADVSQESEVEAMFAAVAERYGRLDVLVNNAGIVKDTLLLTMKISDWSRVMEVDVDGVYYCTRRAVEAMFKARAGRIVNVASVSGIRGGRGQTNYAAAKGAVIPFAR